MNATGLVEVPKFSWKDERVSNVECGCLILPLANVCRSIANNSNLYSFSQALRRRRSFTRRLNDLCFE